MQVLQADWDPTFSEGSYGFRPGRSAHQAVSQAQTYIRAGYAWVADLDLEQFFDRVNHDVLLRRLRMRVSDQRVVRLIHRFLKAGVFTLDGAVAPTVEGTPQGGPLSPLLANLLLDDLDTELERRGHRFVRYADDCNIYVRSRRAGERVLASVTRFLECRLKLAVNAAKSAVDRPSNRTFLGFTFTRGAMPRRKVSGKSLAAFTVKVRELTGRTRGRTINQIVRELRQYVLGWRGYFGVAEGDLPVARPGQVGPASATQLPLEAMGPPGLPGTPETGHFPCVGVEHLQVGTRAVASKSRPPGAPGPAPDDPVWHPTTKPTNQRNSRL